MVAIRGGEPRQVGTVKAFRRAQNESTAQWKEPRRARGRRGPSLDYDAPPGGPSWVIQPFETALRFPSAPFNYAADPTIVQGAAVATVLTVRTPENMLGVLRSFVVYANLIAGVDDLPQLELLIDGQPSLGLQVPGESLATEFVLPRVGFDDPPELTYNIHLRSNTTMEVRAGRVGAVDPTAYTYVFRLKGWFWPRYRRRGW